MKVLPTEIPEVKIIEPRVFSDSRGYFFESYQTDRYREAGITKPFVQDNVSLSSYGTLRGLHYQDPNPQGKLVSVLEGRVLDVAVDLRRESPTFGKWVGVELSSDNFRQLWVPEGFAHGFVALSDTVLFQYKCTALYDPKSEKCIRWNDPTLNIDWGVKYPLISPKDQQGLFWKDLFGE